MSGVDWASESCIRLMRDPRVLVAVKAPHVAGSRDSLLVVADSAWIENELHIAGDSKRRSLRSWEATYDSAYRKAGESSGPSFVGWNDSFTGEAIPLTDMEEWLGAITARVLALPHDRVVEIGCGTGLLVETIAPHCQFYEAADFSSVAVSRLRTWLATRPDLPHVKPLCQAAHDFDGSGEPVDLIIINSVAQHFPDAAYLDTVITNAWKRLREGGHIVLGDIRLLGAQKTFTYAIVFAKAPDNMRADELRQLVQAAWLSQSELLVDPAFFHRFASEHGGTVKVQLKGGRSTCEMTRYRCDVTLGKPGKGVERSFATVLSDIPALREWVLNGKSGVATVQHLSNSRITSDSVTRQLIEQATDELTVAELRTAAARMMSSIEPLPHPADVVEWAERQGLSCDIIAPPNAQDCRFDVIIGEIADCRAPSPNLHAGQYTSYPLVVRLLHTLSVDLHRILALHLPASYLPTRILVDLNMDNLQLVFKKIGGISL